MRFSTVATIAVAVAAAGPALAHPPNQPSETLTRGVEGDVAPHEHVNGEHYHASAQGNQAHTHSAHDAHDRHRISHAVAGGTEEETQSAQHGMQGAEGHRGQGAERHHGAHNHGYKHPHSQGTATLTARDFDFEGLYPRQVDRPEGSGLRRSKAVRYRVHPLRPPPPPTPSPKLFAFAKVEPKHPRPIRPNPTWVGHMREDAAGLWGRDLLEEIFVRSFYDELD
ncbi:hypothetical protein FOMPIDRAFT_1040635 [Fomitopsis schrenkii]|uniref:Uncharacterized protein n=1 Tax=Fomitopsis schrenkii TaxID=2126942 RepID=S8FYG5_FOMSC|nr:hypothetical protein FOMPIDRAFT_1040635 [Fomitopsis schrenkii]